MFERASKEKSRFYTPRGLATVEDLWDISLTGLNQIAKDLSKKIKETSEEDFLAESKEADTKLKNEFDIVIHIMNIKKQEKIEKESAAYRKEQREKLLNILNEKQDESLKKLTPEELRKKIEELQ